MRDFGGTDAEGVGAEGAMCRGVAVAADDEQAGQGEALFGPDYMHDALACVAQAEQGDRVVRRIRFEIAHHGGDLGIGDTGRPAARRHVVVRDAESQGGLSNGASARLHLAEGVERALMHEMPVDPQQRGAVLAPHDLMRRPQLVDQGLRLAHARDVAPPEGLVEGSSVLYAKEYQVKRPGFWGEGEPCATGSAKRRQSRSISSCATAF